MESLEWECRDVEVTGRNVGYGKKGMKDEGGIWYNGKIQEDKVMTIFSMACYVIFGYLVVAGVLLYRKGFMKDVGTAEQSKFTKDSLKSFEKPGAVCLVLAGVAGVLFTAFSDAGMRGPEIGAGVALVVFLVAYYVLRGTRLKKK